MLKKIGNAKQCKLCNKIFSSEFQAVDHVYEAHKDFNPVIVQHLADKKKPEVAPKKEGWKCKFCGQIFQKKEDTVPHLKEIHGIIRPTARERSIQKIN